MHLYDGKTQRDLSMTETSTPKSAKKPHWTSLEIGLITVVSLLFIVIVALVILFATQKTGECSIFTLNYVHFMCAHSYNPQSAALKVKL
uniref:Uncharacterized protein n=1 Tax=Poecilia latipinna TaxID=48699 RepID=A0A3B3U5A7_9TELE